METGDKILMGVMCTMFGTFASAVLIHIVWDMYLHATL